MVDGFLFKQSTMTTTMIEDDEDDDDIESELEEGDCTEVDGEEVLNNVLT